MYFVNIYNEIDVEFLLKGVLNKISFLKSNSCFMYPKLRLFFVFRNILDPDFVNIHHIMMNIWFITGCLPKVKKLGQRLHRGTRYYRFILFFHFSKKKSYKILDLILNDLIILLNNDYRLVSKKKNDVNILFKNFSNLSVRKFSQSFYFFGFKDEFFFNFKMNESNNYFNSSLFFLHLLKL